ncbi:MULTISPECIES: hypothetical protein [unclassified Microbacterium]|uniref:hypothetical protein n=1 Tax=unclassified Microbacterium TaxID=2609290 RepID=UPI001604DCD2|nr:MULTISPECIES: hypothetical protein [unclassified Microbacterium]QNA91365.1 hypothetical protein G4G29_00935 [Microbacterium sp. Se63.02b]QYM64524.1 hypothetical protein K1X59_00940 [Microbacterium sp. Se5.02b]
MAGDEREEIQDLRRRLDEVRRRHHEAWLSGLSVGGGLAFHDQQTRLEDEARALESRLVELGEDPVSRG